MSYKYPRSYHLSWSEGASNDDKISTDISGLIGQQIIISEKLDGGNSSLESNGCFARSHSGIPTHSSFDLLKAFHSTIRHKIPKNIQLFGENMFALHSIAYSELPGYFLLFNVRDQDTWLSWDEVEMWAEEIGVPTVPVLFKGKVDSDAELKKITKSFMIQPSLCGGVREGIVVRVASEFSDNNFSKYLAKMVRKNHVAPNSGHWSSKEIIKNKLK